MEKCRRFLQTVKIDGPVCGGRRGVVSPSTREGRFYQEEEQMGNGRTGVGGPVVPERSR